MERAAPHLFLILFVVTGLFLAWNLPPFMGADELAHFDRADLTALGGVVGHRGSTPAGPMTGGEIELGIYPAAQPFDDVRFHPEVKADIARYAAAGAAHWDTPRAEIDFRGSAAYPPLFYLPASAAIVVGKALRQPVVQTLYLARIAQVLACALIGWLALLLAGRARLWLYAVLLLPMSTALAASVTNDGAMIATTALGVALICRPMDQERPMRAREVAAAAACFAAVGMTKAPYALFGLAFLAAPMERARWRWMAAAAVLAVSAAWTLWTAAFVQIPLQRPDAVLDPAGQIRWLFGHLLDIPGLAVRTLNANSKAYADSFIGVLGWLDTFLPRPFYPLAWAMLAVALGASVAAGRGRGGRAEPWATAAIALAIFGVIHAALYVTWDAVGAPTVLGVQGRYFLPVAVFLALMLGGTRPAIPDAGPWSGLRAALTGAVLIFPFFSLMLVERTIILRYYLH
jgi:uncharacterized membrane protein